MKRLILALTLPAAAALLLLATPAPIESAGKAVVGGNVSPDGKYEVTCDLPTDLRLKNVGGIDEAGLCVFTSVAHAARYQNEPLLWNFQQDMRQERGGGWPEKLERMVEKYGKGARIEQYLGTDPKLIELSLKTGRMPFTTYTRFHMVNTIFLNEEWGAVLDNNHIGEREIRWHKREEYLRLWRDGGQGWVGVLLAPRPAPAPRN